MYAVKGKVSMQFWLRVMVARLAPPPRPSHSNWRIACKYAARQLECGRKIGEKMYVLTGILQAKWSWNAVVEKRTNSPCRTVFAGICAESIVRMPAVHGLYSIDKWEHEFYTNVLTLINYQSNRQTACHAIGGGCLSFCTPQVLFVCFSCFPLIYICCRFRGLSSCCFPC